MKKYYYKIYAANERGECPICTKTTELFNMTEEREYFNPITKNKSRTFAKCRIFDSACYDCQKKKQR